MKINSENLDPGLTLMKTKSKLVCNVFIMYFDFLLELKCIFSTLFAINCKKSIFYCCVI